MAKGSVSPCEVWDRAHTGPKVDVKEYNFKILPELAGKLVKEYNIEIARESVVPVDGSLADAIFQAGFELLLENGLYCIDTGRVIRVTDDEIKEAIRYAPSELTVGEGREAIRVITRGVGDSRIPYVVSGGLAIPCSQEIFVKAMQSYVQERCVDLLIPGMLTSVDGHEVAAHSPYEIRAAELEGQMSRIACALVGRPGMGMEIPEIAVSPEARVAVMQRPSDLHEISIVGELKIDLASLNVLSYWLDKGALQDPESMPLFGGYLGGSVEKMTVVDVAAHLASFTLLSASMHSDGPLHVKWGCTTTRETVQILAHAGAAVDRNTHLLTTATALTRAGPGTEMIFIEPAAQLIASTVSGREMIEGLGANGCIAEDHVDGLLARMMGKIGNAAAKLSPAKANEAINALLAIYDNKEYYKTAPTGKKFQECYDVVKGEPKEEHVKLYNKAMTRLEEITGLQFL